VAKIIELESSDDDPICKERLPNFLPYLVRGLPPSKTPTPPGTEGPTEPSSPTKPPAPPQAETAPKTEALSREPR
jgi:hypothetical protein